MQIIGRDPKITGCDLKLISFSGNNIKTYGKLLLPIEIAGLNVEYEFIVADFTDAEILVGVDLMTEHGINISPREGMIYTDRGNAKFRNMPKRLKNCLRVRCTKTVTIPPFTSMHIGGTLDKNTRYGKRETGDFCGQLEPYYNTVLATGILIAHSIANSENGKIPIRVLNPSDQPVILYKRKVMGQFQPVELGQPIMRVTIDEGQGPNSHLESHSEMIHKNNENFRPQIRECSELKNNENFRPQIRECSELKNNENFRPQIRECSELKYDENFRPQIRECSEPKYGENFRPEGKVKSAENIKTWTKAELFSELKIDELKINDAEKQQLQDMCWEFKSVFSTGDNDIGCCNLYKAHLELKEGYKPRWVPSRPIPYKLQGEMDKHINSMLESGVIEEGETHSNFNSPIFLVPKNTPNLFRFVVDMRLTNLETKDDLMEIPNLNHVLDRVGDNNIYSTFDLSQSFHQIEYTEESRHITAFMYKNKQYNFARMVMGMKTSSSHFCRAMQKLLAVLPIEHLAYFIDDLILFTRDVKSHLELLKLLLGRLQEANLKVTPRKTFFLRDEIKYVGVTLTKEGLKINDERIDAIKKLQPPRNLKELQSVMGTFNYSKKWIKNYSHMAKPLYSLMRKNKKFEWSQACEDSFYKLIESMTTAPVLAFPQVDDPHSSYEITLDGSVHAYGATLSQIINGERRVVAYFSRKIQEHKRVWPQTQLEFETLYQTLKFWSIYVRGCKNFVVVTDCKPLLNITTIFSKMSSNVIRKLQFLANFRFTIRHISGAENHVADMLSRYQYNNYKSPKPSTRETHRVACAQRMEPEKALDMRHAVEEVIYDHYHRNHPNLIVHVNRLEPRTLGQVQVKPLEPRTLGQDQVQVEPLKPRTLGQVQVKPLEPRTLGQDQVQVESLEPSTLGQDYHQVEPSILDQVEKVDTIIPQYMFENDPEEVCRITLVQVGLDIPVKTCYCSIPTAVEHKSPEKEHKVLALTNIPDINENVNVPSKEELQKAQENDDILKEVRSWVQEGKKPRAVQANRTPIELLSYWRQFDLLKIENGLLMRRWVDVKDSTKNRYLIAIPEPLHEIFMKLSHNTKITAHPGARVSLEICRRYYYWPKMHEDFKLYVAACIKCGCMKPPSAYREAPLRHIIFHSFNDGVVIDHIVPEQMGKTPRGYRYILTITDSWSNYIVAIPTKTQTAEENIRLIIHHWALVFGMPLELLADNAPGFKAKFFKTILAAFDCKTTYGQTYRSRTTGRAEKSNARLNSALRACIPENKYRNWDLYVNFATFALNGLRNSHTQYSANFLVFGKELNTPLSVLVDNQKEFERVPVKQSDYDVRAHELYKSMKSINRKVRINAGVHYGYAKKYHDRNITGPFFEEGEECFILVQCRAHKFSSLRWIGPYPIKRKVNDHLYVLTLPSGEDKVFSINKLKKYVRNKYSPPKIMDSASGRKPDPPPAKPQVNRRRRSVSSGSDSDEEFINTRAPTHPSQLPVPRAHVMHEQPRAQEISKKPGSTPYDVNTVPISPRILHSTNPFIPQPPVNVPVTPQNRNSELANSSSGTEQYVSAHGHDLDTDEEADQHLNSPPAMSSPPVSAQTGSPETGRYNLRSRNHIRPVDRFQPGISQITRARDIGRKYFGFE